MFLLKTENADSTEDGWQLPGFISWNLTGQQQVVSPAGIEQLLVNNSIHGWELILIGLRVEHDLFLQSRTFNLSVGYRRG